MLDLSRLERYEVCQMSGRICTMVYIILTTLPIYTPFICRKLSGRKAA